MEDTPKLSENIIPKNEDNATVVLNKPNEANQKDENDPLYPERSELNEKKHLQITLLRIEKELNDSKKKRINSVYKKYIINEELTNRRVRKTLSRSFLCCAFQIFLPIIEIINLIGIFIVISIMNTMFTLLWNSIKSYSLFNLGGQYNLNFYKELYNDSMNQTIDFNIMFFMNFLGDMMLKSKGFVISSFLFLVINWICFFWVYNFTFKDNKESEPQQEPETYTFFNILFILGFFLLLFVGVGGSSMLSQQILLDSYEKLNIYSRKKSKKEKASLERKEKMKKLEEENKMNDSEYKELLKEDKKAEEEEEDSDIEEESDENDDEEKEEEEDEDDEEEFPKISNNKEEDKDKDKKEEIIPVKEPEEENNNIITNDIKNEKDHIEKKLENIEEVGQEHKENSDKDKKEEDKNGDDAKDKDKKKHKKNDLENSKFNYFFLICIITIISYIGKYYFTCILGYRLFKDQTSSSKYLNYFLYLIIIYSACILISIVLYGLFSFIFRTKEKKEVEKKDFYSVFQLLGFTLYKETLSTTNKPKQGGFCLLCESFKDCFNKIVIFPLCNFICCNQLTEESTDNMCTCCCCCCPDYNVEDYHRNNVIFCYCYQERRINKWFHSFLVNKTQKAIIPYMIQYFFLRLFMMGFDKAYDESITEDTGEKSNSFGLFAISFFFFFYITFTFSYFSGKLSKIDENEDKNKEKKEEGKEEEKKEEGKEEEKKEEGKEEEKKEEEKKDEDEKKDVDEWVNMFISGLKYEGTKTGIFSQNILNGTIGIFLVNGLYSLILSSKYLAKSYNSDEELETELGKDNYVIFPVLLNKYYYFTLLYFCLTYSEEQDGFNLISSSTLISLYISAFDFIISIIGVLGTKSVIIIQLVFSCFVGIFWLFIIIAFLVNMIKDKTIKPIVRTLCLFLCRFFIFCLIMAFIDENKKCYCQCCDDCCQKISEEDKEVKIIEEDKGEEKEKFIQEDKSNENKDDKEDKEEIIDV